MIRKFKTLAVALVAVFALGAVVASAASAQQGFLTSTGNVTLTGTETGVEKNRFTAFGGFTECPGSTYTGHKYNVTPHAFIPNGEATATLTPKYKEPCKGNNNTVETIDMNGCDYVVHIGETTEVAGTYGATFDVICPANKSITVTTWLSAAAHTSEPGAPKCTTHIPEQKGLKGAHATDTGNGTIDLTGTLTAISATQTRISILCLPGTSTNTAEFHLDVNVTGKNEKGEATSIALSHS